MSDLPWTYLDEFGRNKHPKRGKCPKSAFWGGGYHRVGYVPVYSLLDGGAPGDVATLMCMDCGKVFEKISCFFLRDQPNALKGVME